MNAPMIQVCIGLDGSKLHLVTLGDLVKLVAHQFGGNRHQAGLAISRALIQLLQSEQPFAIYENSMLGWRLCLEQQASRSVAEEITCLAQTGQLLSNPDGGLNETCNRYGFNLSELRSALNIPAIESLEEPDAKQSPASATNISGTDTAALMLRRQQLIAEGCKKTTATLATEFRISDRRVRQIVTAEENKAKKNVGTTSLMSQLSAASSNKR